MKRFSNIAPAMLAALIALSGIAHADEDDQERARRALEAGEAMPLSLVLEAVTSRIGGEVVGVEIDHEHGRYVYEIKIITPNGRLREIYVDALTADILKNEDD